MAAHERRSFTGELHALSATLSKADTIAASLKELHDADIRRVLSDLTAKNKELKSEQGRGSLLPHQVIDTEKSLETRPSVTPIKVRPPTPAGPRQSDFPSPESCKLMPRVSDFVLREAGISDDECEHMSVLASPPSEKDLALTNSLDTDDTEVSEIGPLMVPRTFTQQTFTESFKTSGVSTSISGLRPEWEDSNASQETTSTITSRCSVRIVGNTKALDRKGSARVTRHSVWSTMSEDEESSLSACLDSMYDMMFGILNPVGPFRFFWNAMCLIWIAYDLFAVPLQAYDIEDVAALQVFEWILTIWWTLDVFMTFRTGYVVGSRVEMRFRKIAVHYAKTWLLIDVIIVIMEWVNRFAVAFGSASLLRSSRALRTFRFLKLFRVTKMHNFWKALQEQINSNVLHLLMTVTVLGAILLLTMHVTSCAWYAIGEGRDDGWISYDGYTGEKTKFFWYVASFRWVVSQFNGRTDMNEKRNMLERFFTCTVGIGLAVIAQAVFISVITKTMLDLSELVSSKTHRRRIVNEYLESNPLPPTLTSHVKRCLHDYQDVNQELQKEDQVLKILPKHLQTDVLYEVRSPILVHHHLFHNLRFESPWIMRHVCWRVVKTVSASKDEVVFEEGDTCDRMLFTDKLSANYFVDQTNLRKKSGKFELNVEKSRSVSGTMSFVDFRSKSILASKRRVSLNSEDIQAPKLISPGDWISEVAVWIEWRNKGRLVSNGHGILLGVQASKLAQTLKKHPDAFALASLYAKNLVSELVERDQWEITDILPFEVHLHAPICVRITIVSAAGLRNADGFFTGKSDPYCVCKVIGLTGKSSDMRFKTATIDNCLNPVWNHSAEIFVSRHQHIEFQVWDLDFPKRDTNLGVVCLAADDFFPEGFEGDLPLNTQSGERAQGSLKLKIEVIQAEEMNRISFFNGSKQNGRSRTRLSLLKK